MIIIYVPVFPFKNLYVYFVDSYMEHTFKTWLMYLCNALASIGLSSVLFCYVLPQLFGKIYGAYFYRLVCPSVYQSCIPY